MVSAIIKLGKTTPFSYNSSNAKKKREYGALIINTFNRTYKGRVPKFKKGMKLYGQVYFFTSEGTNLDADNISKPVWDVLKGTVYEDDKQIVSRTSTVVYTSKHDIITLNGKLEQTAELLQLLMKPSVKCLYIECGCFRKSMIKLEQEDLYED